MKKLIIILLVVFSIAASAQPYRYRGGKWRYNPNAQIDSLQVGFYFRLQGEVFQFSSPQNNQILKRVNGVWTNASTWTLAFDSLKFTPADGMLRFYLGGIEALSDTLDGRYPLVKTLNDSISVLRAKIISTNSGTRSALTDSIAAVRGDLITTAQIDALQNVFQVTLPSSTTVAGRVSGASAGTDYPSTWTLNADGISPYNLVIHHHLHRHIASVSVFTVNGNIERQLFANAAYAGIVASNDSTLTIESLATIQTKIAINLIFK